MRRLPLVVECLRVPIMVCSAATCGFVAFWWARAWSAIEGGCCSSEDSTISEMALMIESDRGSSGEAVD